MNVDLSEEEMKVIVWSLWKARVTDVMEQKRVLTPREIEISIDVGLKISRKYNPPRIDRDDER